MIRKTTMNSFKRYELYNFFPVMAGLTIKVDLKVTQSSLGYQLSLVTQTKFDQML